MLTEQEQYTCAQIAIEFPERASASTRSAIQSATNSPELNHAGLFEFAANAPATIAERHPHLTVFAISAAVLLTAITAEIDCLSKSGYFWR